MHTYFTRASRVLNPRYRYRYLILVSVSVQISDIGTSIGTLWYKFLQLRRFVASCSVFSSTSVFRSLLFFFFSSWTAVTQKQALCLALCLQSAATNAGVFIATMKGRSMFDLCDITESFEYPGHAHAHTRSPAGGVKRCGLFIYFFSYFHEFHRVEGDAVIVVRRKKNRKKNNTGIFVFLHNAELSSIRSTRGLNSRVVGVWGLICRQVALFMDTHCFPSHL